MKLFIGADHRGFTLKNQLLEWLQNQQFDIIDCGNYTYNADDDWPDITNEVVKKKLQEPDSIGILLCGSGAGVSIAANRHKGIYAGVSFSAKQAEHMRARDHVNVLCLPAEYISFETAKEIVTTFLQTETINTPRYLNRIKKIDIL